MKLGARFCQCLAKILIKKTSKLKEELKRA
jgi:hypothetical protein